MFFNRPHRSCSRRSLRRQSLRSCILLIAVLFWLPTVSAHTVTVTTSRSESETDSSSLSPTAATPTMTVSDTTTSSSSYSSFSPTRSIVIITRTASTLTHTAHTKSVTRTGGSDSKAATISPTYESSTILHTNHSTLSESFSMTKSQSRASTSSVTPTHSPSGTTSPSLDVMSTSHSPSLSMSGERTVSPSRESRSPSGSMGDPSRTKSVTPTGSPRSTSLSKPANTKSTSWTRSPTMSDSPSISLTRLVSLSIWSASGTWSESINVSRSFSESHTTSESVSPIPSVSSSSSRSTTVTPDTSDSPTESINSTESGSFSATNVHSSTVSPSLTQTPTCSESAMAVTTSVSASPSTSTSVSPSLGTVTDQNSKSVTRSDSLTRTLSSTATHTSSMTTTLTPSASLTFSESPTGGRTATAGSHSWSATCGQGTASATDSSSVSPSLSDTLPLSVSLPTLSMSASLSARRSQASLSVSLSTSNSLSSVHTASLVTLSATATSSTSSSGSLSTSTTWSMRALTISMSRSVSSSTSRSSTVPLSDTRNLTPSVVKQSLSHTITHPTASLTPELHAYTPSNTLDKAKGIIQALSLVSSIVANPADITNANIQAMLSLLSCVDTTTTIDSTKSTISFLNATSSESSVVVYIISPFYKLHVIAMLFGNVGIVLVLLGIQLAVSKVVAVNHKMDLEEAMGIMFIRCPELSIRAAHLLFPGAVYAAVYLLCNGVNIAAGVVGLILVLVITAATQWYFLKRILVKIGWQPYDEIDIELLSHNIRFYWLANLLPFGMWTPEYLIYSFSPMYASMRSGFERHEVWKFVIAMVSAAFTCIGATFGGIWCDAMAGSLCVLYGIAAIVCLVTHPFVAPHDCAVVPVQYVLLLLSCAMKVAHVDSPSAGISISLSLVNIINVMGILLTQWLEYQLAEAKVRREEEAEADAHSLGTTLRLPSNIFARHQSILGLTAERDRHPDEDGSDIVSLDLSPLQQQQPLAKEPSWSPREDLFDSMLERSKKDDGPEEITRRSSSSLRKAGGRKASKRGATKLEMATHVEDVSTAAVPLRLSDSYVAGDGQKPATNIRTAKDAARILRSALGRRDSDTASSSSSSRRSSSSSSSSSSLSSSILHTSEAPKPTTAFQQQQQGGGALTHRVSSIRQKEGGVAVVNVKASAAEDDWDDDLL